MLSSQTTITTEKANKYVKQMCIHFSHKSVVNESDSTPTIDFGFGTGQLVANDKSLTIKATAQDVAALEKTETVLGAHLERFGFRDKVIVDWVRN